MGTRFWEGYWKSLKPLDVEEPIDVWVHRPLAYLLARSVFRTPVSPNAITLGSVVLGVAALYCLLRGALPLAGLLVFLSAVFDCADGQLARMRGTSSAFGRMLDGLADLVVTVATVGGGTYLVWLKYHEPWHLGALAIGLCAATAVTGSFHTGLYDHYKNLFLRLTNIEYQEGEDLASAEQRFRKQKQHGSPLMVLSWAVYLFYVRSQLNVARWFDPHLGVELGALPPYDADRAALYRERLRLTMKLWRSWFGFGSLVFGLAVAIALNVVEWYMLGRLILLNGVFFLYLRPLQQRVSREVSESFAAEGALGR